MPRAKHFLVVLALASFSGVPWPAAAGHRSFSNDWNLYARPAEGSYSGTITVKLHTNNPSGEQSLHALAARFRGGVPRSHFTRPAEVLSQERLEAEHRAAESLPDLTSFFDIDVPEVTDANALLDVLRADPAVEIAFAQPRPAPPPTIDLTTYQRYVLPATSNGYDVAYARTQAGGNGANVTLIDLQYDWYFRHEDLLKTAADIVWGYTYTNYGKDHGTACLGINGALNNGFGLRGIVDGATIKMVAPMTSGGGYVLANAINNAVTNTAPGDVILLEQQAVNGSIYCPVEYWADVYSAIANVVAMGRIVIEPAGNGSANLEDATWSGIFLRATRDSGAIMVGAGSSTTRARLSFSDYGNRVDVQGWGDSVAATGYSGLSGTVESNFYTSGFSGTSSASALTAGIAASLQSHVRALYGISLTPLELRSNLVQNGSAQVFGTAGNIGPLPNLRASYLAAEAYFSTDSDGDGVPLWQERFAGTDPTNAASRLRMLPTTQTNLTGAIVVTWQSVTGKFYSVERSTNLTAGFAPLFSNVAGVAGTTIRTDVTAGTVNPRIYRIRVQP